MQMLKMKPNCPANCTMCGPSQASEEGPAQWQSAHEQAAAGAELGGWRLLWRAGGAFVLPVASGLAGLVLAGDGEMRRFVGLTIGLGGGMAAAVLVSRLVRGRSRADGTDAKERS